MGAMGVEVCSGPGSYAPSAFNTLSPTSTLLPDRTGRELGANPVVLAVEVVVMIFVPLLAASSGLELESWPCFLPWEDGELTESGVLASG